MLSGKNRSPMATAQASLELNSQASIESNSQASTESNPNIDFSKIIAAANNGNLGNRRARLTKEKSIKNSNPNKLDCKTLWTYYSCPLVLFLLTLSLLGVTLCIGLAGVFLPLNRDIDYNTNSHRDPFYIQVVVSVLVIPLSCMETCLVVSTIHAFRRLKDEEILRQRRNRPRERACLRKVAMLKRQDALEEKQDENSNLVLDTLDNKKLVQKKEIDLEGFSAKSTALLFTAMILLNLSGVCLLWGFTLANNYPLVPEKRAYTFPVVEILAGIACPVLLILFIFVSVVVIRIITQNEIRAEKVIPGLMTFVSFKEGDQFWFWVIADRFYFKVKNSEPKMYGAKKKKLGVRENIPSYCIVIIISVTFILSFSYFMSESLVETQVAKSCTQALTKPIDFDCYTQSWTYVDCTDENNTVSQNTNLLCHRFLTVEESSDYLRAIIQALFIYIACDKFLSVLFRLVTALYGLRKTKLWGIIILVSGIVMLVVCIGSFLIFLVLRNDFNLIRNVQFFILSLDIFLAGLLMAVGQPYEKVERKSEAKLELKSLAMCETQLELELAALEAGNDLPQQV